MNAEELKALIAGTVAEELAEFKAQQTSNLGDLLYDHRQEVRDDPEKRGIGFSRMVQALAVSKGDRSYAAKYATDTWKDGLGDMIAKALGTGTGPAGGFLVPEEFSNEVVELLRTRAVVRAAGPLIVPMPTGVVNIPRMTGGATSSYVGENASLASSEQTFGDIVMTWKKLKTIVPVSNELIRFASPAVDTMVRDDMVASMALREDLAFLRGDGMANTPKGLRNWALAANVLTSNGNTLANIRSDFFDMIQALETASVRMIKPHWFMAPRTKNSLMTRVVDGDGRLVFKDEMTAGNLIGWPFGVTAQIPTNLSVTSTGADESEIYLVDMADVMIGESSDLEIMISDEASYLDATSNTQHSAFDRDQTVIKTIKRHDFAVRHEASIAIESDIVWGST